MNDYLYLIYKRVMFIRLKPKIQNTFFLKKKKIN